MAKTKQWLAGILITVAISACGSETATPLKPPSVYRGPHVQVTHAPTDAVALETIESTTTEPGAIQAQQAWPTVDETQYLLDEIDYLFNKIETRLDRTNVNP